MSSEVHATSSAYHAPKEVELLATRLSKAHGCRVTVSMEASGYHIYLPCPACLEEHGRKELKDPKYAINASKYCQIGDKYRAAPSAGFFAALMEESHRTPEEKRDISVSICMRTRSAKTPHRFSVSELLAMQTITERHPDILSRAEVIGQANGEKEEFWETDPVTGIVSPPLPGKTVSLFELPPQHPAVEYLTNRGFSIRRLVQQFGCEYCYEEYPQGKNNIFYRSFPAGWKDTPAGRIIFYSYVNGQRTTWQARVVEKTSEDRLTRLMWHPYKDMWSAVATRANPSQPWIPKAPFDELNAEGNLKFDPSKYRTAKYSNRGAMGWDAAVKRADADTDGLRWVVLCEGPLDAARVGPGGLAVLGSSLSVTEAARIAQTFNVVILAFDNDKAGREALAKIPRQLMSDSIPHSVLHLVETMTIAEGKDLGDMSQQKFDEEFQLALRRIRRNS